jgi:subtilisin family serine protease
VNASSAPQAASRCAIAHAIERRLATPRTSPRLPEKSATGGRVYGLSATLTLLRRLVFVSAAAALVLASTTSAALRPVRRQLGETLVPRVRPGVVRIPAGHAQGRVTVIARLQLPPLAAYDRGLFSAATTARLNLSSRTSRAYLARLASAQAAAARELKRAIPSARITHRYQVILDGLAVQLPARALPTLARLSSVTKIYPSYRYTRSLDTSPGLIGADAFWAGTGDRGEGVKIGVIDDGIDETNPFFDPAGFAYPAGFPKGGRKWTTPKVIVARAFPGPNSGREGRLALYRPASFHGTHVAGIAAGDANTTAPAGPDHPRVTGLSGVAPRAQIGNYRVFNAPTPTGYDAFTPEIVAAFDSAVRDGMNVINFSGGGPQTDPSTDALVEAVRNVVNAGVVPVIAAGNDRDDFGLGSAGSPSTAPDAISVAAVTNQHVFGGALGLQTADAPAQLRKVPVQPATEIPSGWTTSDRTLADVGSITGTNGQPVDRRLCGPPSDPNAPGSTLPERSLSGAIALVQRGGCTFFSKAVRAHDAGAVGMVIVDNRPGDANRVPLQILDFWLGMVSDLDGAALRDYLAAHGGRAPVRFDKGPLEIPTDRGGVITSFSSAGPTSFGHLLKPDLAAPGAQILSSTLREYASSPFAVFDGTSMATPHVAGAAALLVQSHPSWSPQQIKSALMSTAGPAWGNTARTQEASVLLEGAGLINVARATDPEIFTDPASLSFQDLDVTRSSQTRRLLLTISDAGGEGGTWNLALQPQSATAGATVDFPSSVTLAPGGETTIVVTVQAPTGAATGDDYGFVVLSRGSDTRRVPYYFSVQRPALELKPAAPLKRLQIGTTVGGASLVNQYRFPTAPFGYGPNYFGPTMDENGNEKVYFTHVNQPVANVGVAVVEQSNGALIDPWFLGSQNENDVQGYAGTPVDVNLLSPVGEFKLDVGAAGSVFPSQKRFYIAVDSPRDLFTGRSYAGSYVLRSWINDVTPPRLQFLTTRVTAGRPLLAARVTDSGSGVDPLSLVVSYRHSLVGAALYDRASGLALFPLPRSAPTVRRGTTAAIAVASDYQESKNVDQADENIYPNTTFKRLKLHGVAGPTVAWLLPSSGTCIRRATTLVVAAGASRKISSVRFYDGRRQIAKGRRGAQGLYLGSWAVGHAKRGQHVLRAVVRSGSAHATARRVVRVCR